MGKIIRRIVMILLLIVFLGSVGMVGWIMHQYHEIDQLYDAAVAQYTGGAGKTTPPPALVSADPEAAEVSEAPARQLEIAPITVDFAALQAVNPEVVGWIYCEDTGLNYPVLQSSDNDYYLHRSYDGSYNFSGSIFVEAENRPGFADSNTIIYGHNMKNDSMFACLSDWADQAFYEAHPIIWLLTPERDYKIQLVSGYTTSAYSETYVIFSESGEEFGAYLRHAVEQSDFQANAELDEQGRYVLLSTCAYVFDNARYVLHGQLLPADSAGGIPVAGE